MIPKGNKIIKFINGELTEYTVYDLVDKYDPILRTKTKPFDFSNPPIHPSDLGFSLANSLKDAIGLSANQVGIPFRVFCMALQETRKDNKINVMVFFNPDIISKSEETEVSKEGCLSYPYLYLDIERSRSVTIKYNDVTGKENIDTYYGLAARCIQHEIDHLDGKVFTDLVKPLALKMATEKARKARKRG
jgi:peptide deformylase